MRVAIAAVAATVALLLTVTATIFTARLHTPNPLERDASAVVADALPRLAFLRHALDDGAAVRMQTMFPEGYFFSYALYGLTWVDVGMRDPALRDRALAEVQWSLEHLDSAAGLAPFSEHLDPPYGVFYMGWSTWLRGGAVRLAGADGNAEADRFFADAEALADAFTRHLDDAGSPFLEAYPGQAWPVDSAVALAAVRLANHLRGEQTHDDLIARWWRAVDERRDPGTGLLPHRVDAVTGFPVEGARATSQTVALRFLREIDPAASSRDWQAFRELFASTVPGVPGIREHPRGVNLPGDVDSGPLVMGLTASASVVAIGDAVLFGDRPLATALTGLAEATGMAVQVGGERRYLGGRLPVGDAFLAWSLAADGWIVPAGQADAAVLDYPSPWWRLPWHLATLLLLAAGWLPALVALRGAIARRGSGAVPPRPTSQWR
jgi:hypothetical protein